ncbi:MAG TPA: LPXTG cell wall anchor domain-containing protein [Vicinamibacterales bacterium]|nr:LPXTG cell wall anchor domain-containing protein [Vicinamibacterales bacterium]
MLRKLIVLSALGALMLGASTAQAQPADYRTYFTFSAPVTLPGVTLPAGKYLFRLADPNGSRKVINVLSEDGKKSLAMLHTIPNQLPKAPNDPEIRFMETSSSMPPPIKTWWYPGKSIGYEFIYPRRQALQIAKVTSEPVLTTAAETTDFEKADLSRIDGAGVPAVVKVEETPAPVAATGRAQQGEVAGGSSASSSVAQNTRADESARATTRTRLPQTASSLPSTLLIGGLAMLLGVGLLAWPRSRSGRRPARNAWIEY